MKIVIFEPHPDDLLFGPGVLLLNWVSNDDEIHVITVTDGRACYRTHDEVNIPEDEVAKIRLKESVEAVKFLGIPRDNLHLLKFHDADGQKYVQEAKEEVKTIIKNADRLVLPSDNNGHVDHQATHDIAKRAAKELELDIEYYVYFIPSYGRFRDDSAEKQFEIEIDEKIRSKLFDWLQIYQSQKKTKYSWKFYNRYLKNLRKVKYATFSFEDMDQYYNF